MQNATDKQPIFNVPPIIVVIIVAFGSIHLVRDYFLSYDQNLDTILRFSFIPARYELEEFQNLMPGADWWSPVTYSLLHADGMHLIVNSLWLLIFGAVVARRMGNYRFLMFCLMGSVGGAGAHYITNMGSVVPMIGASAVVSACMGAATRFAFQPGERFSQGKLNRPRLTLYQTITNRPTFAFIGIWLLVNYLTGSGIVDVTGEGGRIAWEAHVGGFLFGLFLFPLFDIEPTNAEGTA